MNMDDRSVLALVIVILLCMIHVIRAQPEVCNAPPDLACKGRILITSHSRNYQIGPPHVDQPYLFSENEAIRVEVIPTSFNSNSSNSTSANSSTNFGGRWAMYGGGFKRCDVQGILGRGHGAVFSCPSSGTYYVFFEDRIDCQNNEVCKNARDEDYSRLNMQNEIFFGIKGRDPDLKAYQDALGKSTILYSDPIVLQRDDFCYQWGYKLEELNAVRFIFDEADPTGTDGSYRLYSIFVWVFEPSEVSKADMSIRGDLDPTPYSMMLTRRFHDLGVTPCVRFPHAAIEVISAPMFSEELPDATEDAKLRVDLRRPHWRFQIKVYLDRTISTLDDITFVITESQHSALYNCFVGNTRVFIPARKFSFASRNRQSITGINLEFSNLSGMRKEFLSTNGRFFYGYDTKYIGEPWLRGRDTTRNRSDVKLIGNSCVAQEIVLLYKEGIYLTSDWLNENELINIILPALDETEVILDNTPEFLDREEFHEEDEKSARLKAKNNGIMKILDFAFIPTHLVVLREDSTVYLHPSNPGLKGLGLVTGAKKYRLGTFVRRPWCAKTSTPKTHNQVLPAFSKDGNIIILFPVPVEGSQGINLDEQSSACAIIEDSTAEGSQTTRLQAQSEEEIHKAEKQKLEEDLKREHDSEKDKTPEVLLREDVDDERVFWFAGDTRLGVSDPHFVKGDTDPANVKLGTDNTKYNENVIFIVEKNFETIKSAMANNGFDFALREELLRTATADITHSKLEREASNSQLFAIHAVEFSAVEKTYLAAIEFQSDEFQRHESTETTTNTTARPLNDLTLFVCSIAAIDFPTQMQSSDEVEIYLNGVIITFSGTLLHRDELFEATVMDPAYAVTDADAKDPVTGFILEPKPLAKVVATMRTINTAVPIYVIKIGDIFIYSSLDGSIAKPIEYFWDYTPQAVQGSVVKPLVRIPEPNYDTVVTERGLISILTRHPTVQNGSAQHALLGSLLTNEPLRTVRPFLPEQDYFQVVVPEGEIVYGRVSISNDTLQNPPFTQFLSLSFWSLLHGSLLRSLGDNSFEVYNPLPPPTNGTTTNTTTTTNERTSSELDPTCPFASFTLDFFQFPFVEAGYRTRLTAEITYYGDSIPLEADIIVEFTEAQGLSIVIESNIELSNDQTIIRKTIDIDSFMPDHRLQELKNYFLTFEDFDPVPEFNIVFTMTIRPSILNLHCNKNDYFKTIQFNVGCPPSTRMRLIAESLRLQKVKFEEFDDTVKQASLEAKQFWNKEDNVISFPREEINFDQRELFGCDKQDTKVCKVPHANLIADNFYQLSFRDRLIPRFEQFLTRHVRKVTGNVVIYDILPSFVFDEKKAGNTGKELDKKEPTQITVVLNQWDVKCTSDDENWYQKLNQEVAHGTGTEKQSLHISTDIYQHFRDCFTHEPPVRQGVAREDQHLLPRAEHTVLSERPFYLFNLTNNNFLKVTRRKRNWIYIFRAVVVNTDYNKFTQCQRLETFFAIRVTEIVVQREPLVWWIYLILLIIVIFCFFLTCVYFGRFYVWKADITASKPDPHARDLEFFVEKSKATGKAKNLFRAAARKILVLNKWKKLLDKDITTTKPSPSKPKPTPSESSKREGFNKLFKQFRLKFTRSPKSSEPPNVPKPGETKKPPQRTQPAKSPQPSEPAESHKPNEPREHQQLNEPPKSPKRLRTKEKPKDKP